VTAKPWRTVDLWGLPLAAVTADQVIAEIDRRLVTREPAYIITANLNYAMLTEQHPDLHAINREATFVTADGMPLVWESRRRGTPLPERVAGSDLIFRLAQHAANRGARIFFLGGPPGVGEGAGHQLEDRYPGLCFAGAESPPYRDLEPDETTALLARIREARPDILILAFGQPRGERWLHAHYRDTGAPVCLQMGASLDFAAGRMRRAPQWMQRTGLEWLFRLAQEPRRLTGRYLRNALFLARRLTWGDAPPPSPECLHP
jgi:N-acetylglucosaminyldiphosphoundecaprenol N-acetyl-beta-D-mannosaminyltransferase